MEIRFLDVHTDQDVGLPFILCPYMEIPDVINIKLISGNAHIWTYELIKHWTSIDKDDYAHLTLRALLVIFCMSYIYSK